MQSARDWHLAQINIAEAVAPLDDPIMAEFMDGIAHINALAEQAPGFIWRLQTDDGDATAIAAFDNPHMIINMSVWRDLASLKAFVFTGDHLRYLQRKKDWFGRMNTPHLACWWLRAGTTPSIEDGKAALAHLAAHGPSAAAFTIARPFAPPGEAAA
ncbi:MAG: DUF3291 domain-containing protein [Geminicoccaceae bacterium]